MKQQDLPTFCDTSEKNELGYFECSLKDLVQQPVEYNENHETNHDAWKTVIRSHRGLFQSKDAGQIRFQVVRWATNLSSKFIADAGPQLKQVSDQLAIKNDFKSLSELFEAKRTLYERLWPKSAERFLRETVETLEEVLKPGASAQKYFDQPDERLIVFAGLRQKITSFEEAFDSENWTLFSQYSSLFCKARIKSMLASLSESGPESMIRQQTRLVKIQLTQYLKSLKSILKTMFPIKLPLLAELMRNSSAASESMSGKIVSLLIGSSQAGKSTILNFLAGATLEAVKCAGGDVFRLHEIPTTLPIDTQRALEHISIGSGFRSETLHVRLLPIHHKGKDHYFCDAPGFGDDRGPEVDISNGIGVVSALQKSNGVKIILVFSGAQVGLKKEGLQNVFKKVAEIVANGFDEALPKLLYLFNNGGDRDFHGLLSDVFSENEPESTDLKKIFTDAICKTCSKDCAYLKEVRSDKSANPFFSKYASSHSNIAKYCFAPASDAFDETEADDAKYTRDVFSKQKIVRLLKEDLKTGFKSTFRNSFLEHVGEEELAIDPKCLKFVCSDESIDILHDSLVQLLAQLDHLCSLKHFRPDIVESKIDQLVSLGASNLFHENFPTRPGVDILQDYKNVLQKIISITEDLSKDFFDFINEPPLLSADSISEALLSFWRLVQLSKSHHIVTNAECFPRLELRCHNLLSVTDFFNRWVDFQGSLGLQFLDALNVSISNQTVFPYEKFQSLVSAMCDVTDLAAVGRQYFKSVSSELLSTAESISSILKNKFSQTMTLVISKYDALCIETSSVFNECSQSVVHFFNQDLCIICIGYFQNLNRIRVFADFLVTLCKENVQDEISLNFDGCGPKIDEHWIASRQKTANDALFVKMASMRAHSMTSSVDDMLCRQLPFDQVLECFENSVLSPLSNLQFVLESVKSHFPSWNHFDEVTELRRKYVESVHAYIRIIMESCGSFVLQSSLSGVRDIKVRILHSFGIPVSQQRIFFEQQELSNDSNLSQYNVPHNGTLSVSLYHASHAIVDIQGASSIMPKATDAADGNAFVKICLPDLLFPKARKSESFQESSGLVDLFKYWVFFLDLTSRCGYINDASSSKFVLEIHQTIVNSSSNFLEKMRHCTEQFISKLDVNHECKYDDEWKCFSQYMAHLSDFADSFCDASFSTKNLFQKECNFFAILSQQCHTTAISLSNRLGDGAEELAQLDLKDMPLKDSMKRKLSSLFIACDEFLNIVQHEDKIQFGSNIRSEASKGSRRFIDSMVRCIEPLSFHCQDNQDVAKNKLDWLYFFLEECESGERSRQDVFCEIALKAQSVHEQCLSHWDQFITDCSSTLHGHASTMERFIEEDFLLYFEVEAVPKWKALLEHVSCFVGALLKQSEPHLPLYYNLTKFKELESHLIFTSKFIQATDSTVSGVLEDTIELMKRLDVLFLKLILFCSEQAEGAVMQRRYQMLSDLVLICTECSGIDGIWMVLGGSGFQRGNPPKLFAEKLSWLQEQRTKQELVIELRHSTSVKNLDVKTFLGEWPGLSTEAKQHLRLDITITLKESTEQLQKLFESIYMKKDQSPLYCNRLNIDHKKVVFAVGSWAPVVFADDEKLQDDLFEGLDRCYDVLQKNAQSSVALCTQALGKYDFQHAEEHFKVISDGCMIVDELKKTLDSVKDSDINVRLQKALKKIQSVWECFQHYVTDLQSEFSLASQKVLQMYDCKSAVINGPANIETQNEGFDNLFVHVPINVGIGIEITENKTNAWSRVQVANVFDGSPAWHCGIRKHDVLIKVDDISCSKASIQEIRQAIMGPLGSVVEIHIKSHSRVLTVTRDLFGLHLPETKALSLANPVLATSLVFRKFSSDNNLVILLENEEMMRVPNVGKKPCPPDAEQFCSLHFGELRNKVRSPVHVLNKLNFAEEYRSTGTAYDDIQQKLKLHLDKELSSFVDLLLSKRVTSEDAKKWQNKDIFSDELLAYLPDTKEKMQLLKRKIEASSQIGLKPNLKPFPSIADDVDALHSCHLIKTTSVIRVVEAIEDKICSYCKQMIESPELFQRYLEPAFREEYSRWSLFWHFLYCLDPPQTVFQPRSWHSWKLLESAFRKSVCNRIPGRPVPRCCDAFSDVAFTYPSSNSKEVVDAVEASFMILREKSFWKTATLSDFFHDENFHEVLQKLIFTLRHFYIEKMIEFDDSLKTMSRVGDCMREKNADYAWMTTYYKIYKMQSATSECLFKFSKDPSINWIVDSNGLLREFGADLEPSASSDSTHFPFVTTFVQLDRRIREIFKVSLDIVLARFHESDDCRSPSILNHEKVYKQLNDNYQTVKEFVKVFPDAVVEVLQSNSQISRTAGSVLHDIQQHFQNVLSFFKSESEEVLGRLHDVAIASQFETQIHCYRRLMICHHSVSSWKKTCDDSSVKDLVIVLMTKMDDGANSLLSKIGEIIQEKAIDLPFDDFCVSKNVSAVCCLFRALRCMASNLPLVIHQRTPEMVINHWFGKILGEVKGSFRMKRICKQDLS
jgi:hypothetical protein